MTSGSKPAAVLPVSSRYVYVDKADTATPAWVFAGDQDEQEGYCAEQVKKALQARRPIDGTRTRFDGVRDGHHHECTMWNDVYRRGDVYEWLLEQAPC